MFLGTIVLGPVEKEAIAQGSIAQRSVVREPEVGKQTYF
jgi:hypothetical protein